MQWFNNILILITLTFALTFTSGADARQSVFSDQLDFQFGLSERIRYERYDDPFDFSEYEGIEDLVLYRFKTLASFAWSKDDKYRFETKISNEARYFVNNIFGEDGFNSKDLVFDNFAFHAKQLGGLPLDVSIGRMDLLFQFGSGFILMDGTPDDGSATFYHNAFRAKWHFSPDTNVDLLLLSNPKKDKYLPTSFDEEQQRLNHSDERGLLLYGRHRFNPQFYLEPYYVYKREEDPAMEHGLVEKDLDLHTVGGRALIGLGEWQLEAEYARQFGEYASGRERRSHGGYSFFSRKIDALPWPSKLTLGGVYLSGDDPDTAEDEGWNPVFSRHVWQSELFVATLLAERGFGYWTNTKILKAGINMGLAQNTQLNLEYLYLGADEDSSNPFIVRDKRERGHLGIVQLNHRFSKSVSGYVRFEHMSPGQHYHYSDHASFLRLQLEFKI